ncbi:hypothetical protein Tco_0211377 [Tanacetum coccineum]
MKEDIRNVLFWVKLHGVPVMDFYEDELSAIATKIGTLLMLDSYTSDICFQSWDKSRYARARIELRADEELKDTIVVAMPRITGEGFYRGTAIRKTMCRNLSNEVSNSNPFDVLNTVDNDIELGTNGRTSNSGNKGAKSSGSSFRNVKNSSTSTTPIIDKIGKHEILILRASYFVDEDDGNGNYVASRRLTRKGMRSLITSIVLIQRQFDRRGYDIDSVEMFPICDDVVETEEHLFVDCKIARDTWINVLNWWRIPNTTFLSLQDVFQLADDSPLEAKFSRFFDAVIQTTIWSLWRFRNNVIFSLKKTIKDLFSTPP